MRACIRRASATTVYVWHTDREGRRHFTAYSVPPEGGTVRDQDGVPVYRKLHASHLTYVDASPLSSSPEGLLAVIRAEHHRRMWWRRVGNRNW